MGKRIGIMGGTFDPIHTGHLLIAESAADQLGLDTVLFMPAACPPHKSASPERASREHRIRMTELAIEGNDNFRLSLYEMQHEGKSFSYKTLEALHAVNPDNELYFIMGADSLFTFDSWVEPGRIASSAILAVCVRDHRSDAEMEKQAIKISDMFHADIRLLNSPNIDISSTDIRERIHSGRSIRYFLPEAVRNYILENRLYSGHNELSSDI